MRRLHDPAQHGGSSSSLPTPASRCGLGLFIARRVMALHGGRLQLRHNPAHGLAASLVLPLPADDGPAQPPEPGGGSRCAVPPPPQHLDLTHD